jgi:hypothetical protein
MSKKIVRRWITRKPTTCGQPIFGYPCESRHAGPLDAASPDAEDRPRRI